jgi:hypothetical protein
MSAEKTVVPEKSKKDSWEKADIILRPLGALITAITIALVGFFANYYITQYQQKDTKAKLFTELMSQRENSESALRKDMFNSIMNNILNDKEHISIDEKILQLELLAYNFHESLNLMPLFEYLDRLNNKQNRKNPELRYSYRNRVIKMSDAIIQKQISTLEENFKHKDCVFTFGEEKDTANKLKSTLLNSYQDSIKYNNAILKLKSNPKYAYFDADSFFVYKDTIHGKNNSYRLLNQSVQIQVSNFDPFSETATITLNVTSTTSNRSTVLKRDLHHATFNINHFEFPMIDNTRLENDMRLAVVLHRFNVNKNSEDPAQRKIMRIEFSVVYFPASLASLKEKSNLNDLLLKFEAEN